MAKLNPDRILAAVEESMFGTESLGFCKACGEEQMGVEPDAENYECYSCGENEVFGAEQLLLMGYAGQ